MNYEKEMNDLLVAFETTVEARQFKVALMITIWNILTVFEELELKNAKTVYRFALDTLGMTEKELKNEVYFLAHVDSFRNIFDEWFDDDE